MINAPLISVVTAVLNQKVNLQKTLDLTAQVRYPRLQHIVVDGGSIDGTLDVIRANEPTINTWISEPDRGISHAFNKGIRLSHGLLIGILNAGDWYEPDAVNVMLAAAAAHPDVDVFCGAIQFWEGGKPSLLCHSNPEKLERETSVYHPTVFIRKSAYEKYGLYNESFRFAMDYELLLRFKRLGARFLALDNVLANMTLDGISYLNWYEGLKEVRKARSKYFPFHNVVFHHARAVAMNLAARALKKGGLGGLYQSYWRSRNEMIETGRRREG